MCRDESIVSLTAIPINIHMSVCLSKRAAQLPYPLIHLPSPYVDSANINRPPIVSRLAMLIAFPK